MIPGDYAPKPIEEGMPQIIAELSAIGRCLNAAAYEAPQETMFALRDRVRKVRNQLEKRMEGGRQ